MEDEYEVETEESLWRRRRGEYWRVALEDGDLALSLWLLEFCIFLWLGKVVPDSWHEFRVDALFKKGDLGDCGYYRRISLVCTAYKLFVMVLMAISVVKALVRDGMRNK